MGTDGRKEAGVGEGIVSAAWGGGRATMGGAAMGREDGKSVSTGAVRGNVEGVNELAKEEGDGGVFDVLGRRSLREEALGDGVEGVEGGEGILNWGVSARR